MIYSKSLPVPPLPIRSKIRITHIIHQLVKDIEECYVLGEIQRYSWDTKEERDYAVFWWLRELHNPNWREEDKQRKTPIRTELRAVK